MTELATQELSVDTQYADNALQDALKRYAQLHNVDVNGFMYAVNHTIDEALQDTAEVPDNYKQPALVQSAEVMCVSIDDFTNTYGHLYEYEDDEDSSASRKMVEMANTFTSIEWKMIGEIMSDWMYDGDKFDNALEDAYATVVKRRGAE